MIPLTILAYLTLVPFTLGQANVQVAAIEAHFKQSQIVPQLLTSFNPSALLAVNFAGVGDITPGQLLTKEQSAPTPMVTVSAANSNVQLSGKYTITMVDADVVGSDLSKGVNHHWLVNGVEITDGKVSNASATSIVSYAGPGPAVGSGPHRYVIILYAQPDTFKPPADLSQPTGVGLFDLNGYVKNSGLGALMAASYITVEEGTVTISIPATSSIISSTLVAAAPTSSGQVGAPSGPLTTGAASPTKSNSATSVASSSPLALLFTSLVVVMVGA
ncbi:CEN-like protein 1 [Termitomyces sp. J132]|nr:hypothetical protein H2248_009767 [Termitomyces sp. 'cryptogamus']KNZ81457.1 CEN-like protein 1 [Termitomyces sp. J132]